MTATVQLVERIASAATTDQPVSFLNIHGADTYSTIQRSYVDSPVVGRTDGAPVFSMERYVRLRFTPPFDRVRAFRFWVPDWVDPTGWTIKWGVAPAFSTPSNSESAWATATLPSADPGQLAPNIGGEVAVDGSATRYSDWIVLQAQATGDAEVGPILGWDTGNVPIPIPFKFKWVEN